LPNQTAKFSEETHWEKAAKTRMGKYLTQIETEFISRTVNLSKPGVFIDVGAEAGRFSMLAANNAMTVIGIDIDNYSLRRLKRKNREVMVVQADARRIPFRNAVFDGVFMIEVLDYIPSLGEALGECHRVLKPQTPFVVSFGNQSSMKAKIRGFRGKSYTHNYKKVMRCLKETGFKVTAKLGYSWLPFGRMSESKLVSPLSAAEKLFGLRKMPGLSPWVLLGADKSP
jgi:ubiquinone/menaquinone biosynthesis C-methylase UbiE